MANKPKAPVKNKAGPGTTPPTTFRKKTKPKTKSKAKR